MDYHAVELAFPLPYMAPLWRVRPDDFLAHFVGHEGPGSLHAYLKNKGWVTTLSAGSQNQARGFGNFKISIQLTQEGFCKSTHDLMESTILYALYSELPRRHPRMP